MSREGGERKKETVRGSEEERVGRRWKNIHRKISMNVPRRTDTSCTCTTGWVCPTNHT